MAINPDPTGSLVADVIKLVFKGAYSLSSHAEIQAAVEEARQFLLVDEAFKKNWENIPSVLQAQLDQDKEGLEQALKELGETQEEQKRIMLAFFQEILKQPRYTEQLDRIEGKLDSLGDKIISEIEKSREFSTKNGGPPVKTNNPHLVRLRIEETKITYIDENGETITVPIKGPDATFQSKMNNLVYARRRASKDLSTRGPQHVADVEQELNEMGRLMGKTFLPQTIAEKLARRISKAQAGDKHLLLATEFPPESLKTGYANLPWETMRVPGATDSGPLGLHPNVCLFRRPVDENADITEERQPEIPGPLRILVAIGSPDEGKTGNHLLNYEYELHRILNAIGPVEGHVRILEVGSPEAINKALTANRYHILYISGHASPGTLILENEEGSEVKVTPKDLTDQIFPTGRKPPLVVLAACSTALSGKVKGVTGEEELPNIAIELVEKGVSTVIAMQAPVSDLYASMLAGRLFNKLSTEEEPRPLPALHEACRFLDVERKKDASQNNPLPPEWATPVFFSRHLPSLLFNPDTETFKAVKEPQQAVFDQGVVVRRIDDFIGRRREQRELLRHLRDPDSSGALIRGIGGVGKSTLAAQVVHRLVEGGMFPISVAGETNPEKLLERVGQRLLDQAQGMGMDHNHPLREIANLMRRGEMPWEDRFRILSQNILPQVPILLLVDNFEDNLVVPDGADGWEIQNDSLGKLLALWLNNPGMSRLLVTSRYPFPLPDSGEVDLKEFHLGPLSFAETRKLIMRLEGVKALGPKDQRRAWEEVGGHPRSLEYLDALLRGKARFKDIEKRLTKSLKAKGQGDFRRWCRTTKAKGDFDRALAEMVTFASDEILLDTLVKQIAATPLAERLLLGAAVYRMPVDETALAWQVGTEVDKTDPEMEEAWKALNQAVGEAKEKGEKHDLASLAGSKQRLMELMNYRFSPPIEAPEGIQKAIEVLMDSSMLTPVQQSGEKPTLFFVHRWTSTALLARTDAELVKDAHSKAARYWRWRWDKLPQSKEVAIRDLLEARFHHVEAGDYEEAIEETEEICDQLHTWGQWGLEEQLCRETLAWTEIRPEKQAVFIHGIGNLASGRGDYETAEREYRRSLEIKEEIGNRAGMARSYNQLGILADARGDYETAEREYRRSLEINEEIGSREDMASTYHNLGVNAQNRGDYETAEREYRRSLEMEEEIGNRAGMAGSYNQLGILADARGDYETAEREYRRSLEINEEIGSREDMASTYHNLGVNAQNRGDYETAEREYRRSLEIEEEIGNRAGMATSYHQLGRIAEIRGDYETAEREYRRSLEIGEEIGNRAGMATALSQLGVLRTEQDRPDEALVYNIQSLLIRLQIGSPKISTNLHWLNRQREILGAERFEQLVGEQIEDAELRKNLFAKMDEFEEEQKSTEVESGEVGEEGKEGGE